MSSNEQLFALSRQWGWRWSSPGRFLSQLCWSCPNRWVIAADLRYLPRDDEQLNILTQWMVPSSPPSTPISLISRRCPESRFTFSKSSTTEFVRFSPSPRPCSVHLVIIISEGVYDKRNPLVLYYERLTSVPPNNSSSFNLPSLLQSSSTLSLNSRSAAGTRRNAPTNFPSPCLSLLWLTLQKWNMYSKVTQEDWLITKLSNVLWAPSFGEDFLQFSVNCSGRHSYTNRGWRSSRTLKQAMDTIETKQKMHTIKSA